VLLIIHVVIHYYTEGKLHDYGDRIEFGLSISIKIELMTGRSRVQT
jgi:hypothetical protein